MLIQKRENTWGGSAVHHVVLPVLFHLGLIEASSSKGIIRTSSISLLRLRMLKFTSSHQFREKSSLVLNNSWLLRWRMSGASFLREQPGLSAWRSSGRLVISSLWLRFDCRCLKPRPEPTDRFREVFLPFEGRKSALKIKRNGALRSVPWFLSDVCMLHWFASTRFV